MKANKKRETKAHFRARCANEAGRPYSQIPITSNQNDALRPIVARRGNVFLVEGMVSGTFERVVLNSGPVGHDIDLQS